MNLEKFNELLSPEEKKSCQIHARKTWYSMPLEVFTSFIFKVCISHYYFSKCEHVHLFFLVRIVLIFCLLCMAFQQEIVASADAAVRKYNEDTPSDEITKDGVAAAMRFSIKDSTERLYKKLSKIVSVANPALGSDWLKEV
jgi:hypothetical protein